MDSDELSFALAIAAHEPAWFSHLRAHERTRAARPHARRSPLTR